jgi:hypothetical protein
LTMIARLSAGPAAGRGGRAPAGLGEEIPRDRIAAITTSTTLVTRRIMAPF